MIQSITFFKSPADILKSYDKPDCSRNTWDDWHILADSRPVFTPPEVKSNYIDVPGGNGLLDLSESLTRYPVYKNRTGSFTFRVMNDYVKRDKNGKEITVYESNDTGRWAQRYSDISEYLHGQSMCAVLADDPTWFYQGRFTVDDWKSADTWSELTIGYNVNPFKWKISSSASPWLWDPFNFETDVIWEDICTDIPIKSTNDSWMEFSFPAYTLDENSVKQFFGSVPISPTFIFSPKCPVHDKALVSENGIFKCPVQGCGTSDTGFDVRFINTYLGIDITQHFTSGSSFAPDFLFYGQTEPYTLYFRGNGSVSIDFRIGRL